MALAWDALLHWIIGSCTPRRTKQRCVLFSGLYRTRSIFLPFALYIFLNLALLFLAAGIAAAANHRPIWSSGFYQVLHNSIQQLIGRSTSLDESA
jgi:hypothetical protein